MTDKTRRENTSWYRIVLTPREFAAGETMILLGAFRAAYVARNGPAGMALFGCRGGDGDGYLVYVTPKAVRHVLPLLAAYTAKPAPAPEPGDLEWLYGDDSRLACFGVELQA